MHSDSSNKFKVKLYDKNYTSRATQATGSFSNELMLIVITKAKKEKKGQQMRTEISPNYYREPQKSVVTLSAFYWRIIRIFSVFGNN